MYTVNTTVLRDRDFLQQLDTYPIRESMAKIIVTDFDENPIGEITGKVISGNISVDGSSACRRTCNLTLVTVDKNVNELDWQLHTKYVLLLGRKNEIDTSKYPEWIWFPQGTYVLTDFGLANTLSGFTVTVQGKDKMCLLDGSVGGALFAQHDFSTTDYMMDGRTIYEDTPIYTMIREAIHTYAREPYHNIMINDLEDVSVELLDYKVNNLDCYVYDVSNYEDFHIYSSGMCFSNSALATDFFDTWFLPGLEGTIHEFNNHYYRVVKKITYGDTAGYRRTELTYPGELIVNAGGTVVDMLKKVVEVLGEYEYFYDVYGHFIFQRKRIYHNVVWNGTNPTESQNGYFTSSESTASIYDFTGAQIIESYNNKPQMNNIRNDWAIWGKLGTGGTTSSKSYPCHLRYAIDDKPIAYHCLSDGRWYVAKGYTLQDVQDSQAWLELQAYEQEYENYLRSFKKADGTCVYTEQEITSHLSNYFGHEGLYSSNLIKLEVDYRELIYRMALDWSVAEGRIKELHALQGLKAVPLVNTIQITQPDEWFSNFTNIDDRGEWDPHKIDPTHGDYYNISNNANFLYFYDLKTNSIKRYDKDNDLEAANEIRSESNLSLFKSIQDYMAQQSHIYIYKNIDGVFSSTETIMAHPEYDEDTPFTGTYNLWGLDYAWPARGLKFKEWIAVVKNNRTYYGPVLSVTLKDSLNIINQEIQWWEKRLSSDYSIYFTDMLAFWNLYYKVDNDLTNDDVPQAFKAGLNYQTLMQANLAGLSFGGLQSEFENNIRNLNRITTITNADREARKSGYYHNYSSALQNEILKINRFETQLTAEINKITNPNYQDLYTSNQLAEIFNRARTYAQTQKSFLDAQLNINDISTLYNGYKEAYKVLLEAFNNKQKELAATVIERAFALWDANGHWNPDVIYYDSETDYIKFIAPENMLFWIDFMDTNSALGKYKIKAIGHRAKVVNDDNIKAIFFRDTPNVLWIDPDDVLPDEQNISYVILRLNNGLSNFFRISTQGKDAKDTLDTMIYEQTYYQETITVSILPIYWFEPNQRIRLVDEASGIRGEYIIKSYSLPLAYDGMMQITAYKAADRII